MRFNRSRDTPPSEMRKLHHYRRIYLRWWNQRASTLLLNRRGHTTCSSSWNISCSQYLPSHSPPFSIQQKTKSFTTEIHALFDDYRKAIRLSYHPPSANKESRDSINKHTASLLLSAQLHFRPPPFRDTTIDIRNYDLFTMTTIAVVISWRLWRGHSCPIPRRFAGETTLGNRRDGLARRLGPL